MDFEESTCFFPSISVNIHHPDISWPLYMNWSGSDRLRCCGSAVFLGKCDMFYMCDHYVTLQIEILNCTQKCFVRRTSWLSDFLFGPLWKKVTNLDVAGHFEAVKKSPMIHQQEICYYPRSLFTKLWGVGDIMVIQSSVEKTTNVIQQSFAFFFASVNSLFGFTSPCIELILYLFFNIHINLFVDKQTFIYIHIFIYLHNIYIYTLYNIYIYT